MWEISGRADSPFASQEGLYSVELVSRLFNDAVINSDYMAPND